jgi:hypothetical protein
MRSSDDADIEMCPFLRSVRQAHSGRETEAFTNACYLQRRPNRGNLIHALHTQANLCTSTNHVMCPHYRVAARTRRRRAKAGARA